MNTPSTNTLGKYQIIREIARSNDIVYEAIDPTINRRIALKELWIAPNLQGAQRRERIERFWREGKAAGRLSHPNIVTIFEVGKEGDRHFIAMEYLEGQTLRDVMQVGGPIAVNTVVDYTLQLCSALAYAHANGVVHRDIKPENVQILPGGYVKLTDFGIARIMGEPGITRDGQVFGTPSYMSPEQVAGKEIDERSDIFSLGVMIHEMLAGKKPFAGDSIVTITYNIMHLEAPPPPGAPPYMSAVIRKAMAKEKDARYSSIEELAQDIRDQRVPNGFTSDVSVNINSAPSPFGGGPFGGPTQFPPQQQPQGPMTPYGTPMPSQNSGASPDPFAQGPAPAPTPPPMPAPPILSSETRNFLGVFLMTLAFVGMLAFFILAVNWGYNSWQIAQGSDIALGYYNQGRKLYSKGDVDGAVEQWQAAIRVAPNSKIADTARYSVFNVLANTASERLSANDISGLAQTAKDMIKAKPDRAEGHYYLAVAAHRSGNMAEAKSEYEQAIKNGGNDAFALAARRWLGSIYLNDGSQYAAAGNKESARSSYQKAIDLGDADSVSRAQQAISELN